MRSSSEARWGFTQEHQPPRSEPTENIPVYRPTASASLCKETESVLIIRVSPFNEQLLLHREVVFLLVLRKGLNVSSYICYVCLYAD